MYSVFGWIRLPSAGIKNYRRCYVIIGRKAKFGGCRALESLESSSDVPMDVSRQKHYTSQKKKISIPIQNHSHK